MFKAGGVEKIKVLDLTDVVRYCPETCSLLINILFQCYDTFKLKQDSSLGCVSTSCTLK